MKTVEYEKKMLLSLAEYTALFQALSSTGKTVTQVNHYYDTPDLDGNTKGITYRIREKNGKFIATVKSHHVSGRDDNIEISGEVNSPFDTSFFTASDLCYHGCLTTERLIICPCNGIELALDKNRYFQFTDYELEIEYSENTEKEAENILQHLVNILHASEIPASFLSVVCRLNTSQSKSERFFARKAYIERNEE